MFVADALRESCPSGTAPPVISLGIPRAYIPQDKPDRILARLGLDAAGIARSVRAAVGVVVETSVDDGKTSTPPARPTPRAPARPATMSARETTD
jgi:1-deoxy-D-xylulose-5-phosphate synthase